MVHRRPVGRSRHWAVVRLPDHLQQEPTRGSVVADFYTFALFDLDSGEYGTYTDYDMPPHSMQPGAEPKMSAAAGHLDLTYRSPVGTASWVTCRDGNEDLIPYTYRVTLVGEDQAGQPMELDLTVTPTRAPTPLGAATYNGKITCFGQDDTYSYFQTGMAMTGTLRWADRAEQVSGTAGHVDRQWFPLYAGGGTGEPPGPGRTNGARSISTTASI